MTITNQSKAIELEFHASSDVTWDEFMKLKEELKSIGYSLDLKCWADSFKALVFKKQIKFKEDN